MIKRADTHPMPIPTMTAIPIAENNREKRLAPSSASPIAMKKSRKGSAIPSLSPDSMLSAPRIRAATRVLDTTGAPSAASVGASTVATMATPTRSNSGKSPAATIAPVRIINGIPKPRRRLGSSASSRPDEILVAIASVNSTRASVISNATVAIPVTSPVGSSPSPTATATNPTAAKNIGPEMMLRLRRLETSA